MTDYLRFTVHGPTHDALQHEANTTCEAFFGDTRHAHQIDAYVGQRSHDGDVVLYTGDVTAWTVDALLEVTEELLLEETREIEVDRDEFIRAVGFNQRLINFFGDDTTGEIVAGIIYDDILPLFIDGERQVNAGSQ